MDGRNRYSKGRDNRYFGAFLGLAFPMVGFFLFYVFAFSEKINFQQYWDQLFYTSKMSAALSLAIIMNLPVFFINLWNNRYENAKGVVGATIFYGAFIILFKFF